MQLLLPPSRTVRGDAAVSTAGDPPHPPLLWFTGTLFTAFAPQELGSRQLTAAGKRIHIHDPQRGLVRGDRWESSPPVADLVSADRAVIDLRSKEYARRDPIPDGGWTLRVVSEGEDGRRLAVSHWNKHHKGVFVGALVRARPWVNTVPGLLRWSAEAGFRLERIAPGHLDLVV